MTGRGEASKKKTDLGGLNRERPNRRKSGRHKSGLEFVQGERNGSTKKKKKEAGWKVAGNGGTLGGDQRGRGRWLPVTLGAR